ncbi:hypothetical protein [Flexivirga alba]|uniref:Cytochrome b561 bacterial/Ni-hydrogenase domain-containing protein n=1 Tax=Flexivirga alba TaxID=702742 RepID=A0ABW2ACS3_9MICO
MPAAQPGASTPARRAAQVALDELTDRTPRSDPALPRTGGPAGNARITAWTGLVLLVLLAIEGVTVLDIHGLISWHIVVGLLLIPPALLKVASTGWRIVRFYTGEPSYRLAGPPQLVMRVLGPLVILLTLAVLATGIVVAVQGPAERRHGLLGLPVTGLFLHQATFFAWLAVMTLHVLGRTVRAVKIAGGRAGDGSPGSAPASRFSLVWRPRPSSSRWSSPARGSARGRTGASGSGTESVRQPSDSVTSATSASSAASSRAASTVAETP